MCGSWAEVARARTFAGARLTLCLRLRWELYHEKKAEGFVIETRVGNMVEEMRKSIFCLAPAVRQHRTYLGKLLPVPQPAAAAVRRRPPHPWPVSLSPAALNMHA